MGHHLQCLIGVLVAGTIIGCGPAGNARPTSTIQLNKARPAILTVASSTPDLCRLAVTTGADNGFLTYPSAIYTADPAGKPKLPGSSAASETTNYGYAYDAAFSRWVPVTPNLVSPDGTKYVYSNLLVVDVQTGTERQLAVTGPGLLHPIGWQPEGIYAVGVNSQGQDPGLWLISYPAGTARQISDRGYWQAVSHGAAYGTLELVPPPDTSDAIIRLDVASGAITKWFYLAGSRGPYVAGFDASGAPVIQQSVQVYLVPTALQPVLITPSTKASYAFGDGWGIWIGNSAGLFLFSGGHFTRVSDLPAWPAAACTPPPASTADQPPASSSRTYTVLGGDSLFAIARAFGLSSYWPLFWRNEARPQPNGDTLINPDLIRPGWVLEIPTEPLRTYMVKPGDTLSAIAELFYGSGHGGWWKGIYDANRDQLSNPSLIYSGQSLRIP